MSRFTRFSGYLVATFLFLALADHAASQATPSTSRLDQILAQGYIRVGTTGDFKPFTYYDPETDDYEGIDIEAARKIARDLGVELRWVKTTWPTLIDGILDNHYDIAVGGITRTLKRQQVVGITAAYFETGKCPLVRKEDSGKFNTIDSINKPEVRIGVNPGGTNERFVRSHLPNATITVFDNNLSIPRRVLAGEVDVMITDNAEAMLFSSELDGLAAVNPSEPFTRDDFGYLVARDDAAWLNWLNLWIHQSMTKGDYQEWERQWFKTK